MTSSVAAHRCCPPPAEPGHPFDASGSCPSETIPADHHIACSQAAAHHCLERQRACWEIWLDPLRLAYASLLQSARLPIHAFSHWQTLLRFPGPVRACGSLAMPRASPPA